MHIPLGPQQLAVVCALFLLPGCFFASTMQSPRTLPPGALGLDMAPYGVQAEDRNERATKRRQRAGVARPASGHAMVAARRPLATARLAP